MSIKLLSAQEVIGKSPAHLKLSATSIDRDHIDDALYATVMQFIGSVLYNKILADKKEFCIWSDKTASYNINDLVFSIIDFQYYQRITTNGNNQPQTDAGNWQVVRPFNNDDYNKLWFAVLWKFCAYSAIKDTLPFIWAQITTAGIVANKSDTYDSVKQTDVSFIQRAIGEKIKSCQSQLHDYICSVRSTDITKFTDYPHKCDGCENKELTGKDGVNQDMGMFLYEGQPKNGYTDYRYNDSRRHDWEPEP